MTLKELLQDYQWVFGDVFIYSFDWYQTDNENEQKALSKLYTVFSTENEEKPYYSFNEDIGKFNENKVYAWWCDEKGLGIMLDEFLDKIKKENK